MLFSKILISRWPITFPSYGSNTMAIGCSHASLDQLIVLTGNMIHEVSKHNIIMKLNPIKCEIPMTESNLMWLREYWIEVLGLTFDVFTTAAVCVIVISNIVGPCLQQLCLSNWNLNIHFCYETKNLLRMSGLTY